LGVQERGGEESEGEKDEQSAHGGSVDEAIGVQRSEKLKVIRNQ
jgi:hypothetical protein